HRQDREPAGREQLRRDPQGDRRRHGRARRPRHRDPARAGLHRAEDDDHQVQHRRQARHHRHADAGEHDVQPAPDARG
ncbi:hypothetical protein LTS01_026094, partial [Friedmanniomyces endolithicus]